MALQAPAGGEGIQLTHGSGLAAKSVNSFEVTAQSVANVAPSAVIAFGPAAMAATAAYGAWFAWIIASAGVFAIAYCINLFAKRRASVGSLYALARLSLGPSWTFITGWALVVGVIAIASGSLAGVGYFIGQFFSSIGVSSLEQPGWQALLDMIMIGVALFLTITSVRRAAVVAATLEVISITLIVIISLLVLVKHGNIFDSRQLSLKGATSSGVISAIVIAVLGFVGFESAAALGEEAQDPIKAVPRAIWRAAILAAVLYTFATYVQVLGFGSASKLATDASPMDYLVGYAGVSWMRGFMDIGFTSSFFAVVVACMNVAGRIWFGMAREGIMPKRFGTAHASHRTPSFALMVTIPLVAIPAVALVANGNAPLSVTTWVDEVGVYGYMLSYALICVAAPLFMHKLKDAKQIVIAWSAAIVGLIVMAYTFWKQIYPAPAYPLDILPYIFIGGLMVGVIGYAYVYLRDPETARRAGTYADDLNTAAA